MTCELSRLYSGRLVTSLKRRRDFTVPAGRLAFSSRMLFFKVLDKVGAHSSWDFRRLTSFSSDGFSVTYVAWWRICLIVHVDKFSEEDWIYKAFYKSILDN